MAKPSGKPIHPEQAPGRFAALALDDGFLDCLRRFPSWRVHSGFRRVINLVSRECLLTIATRHVSLMPNTLLSSANDFGIYALTNAPVHVANGELRIGGLCFALDGPVRSSRFPLMDAAAIPPGEWKKRLALFGRLLERDKSAGSFYAAPDAGTIGNELRRLLLEGARELREAATRPDGQGALRAAEKLLGLGVGLTPSGDDYLLGFFAALLLEKKGVAAFRDLALAVARNAGALTNIISASALRHAAEGRFKEEIGDLVRILYARHDEQKLEAALRKLLAIGSTSGTDIARGIFDAMTFHEFRGEEL